VRDVLAALKVAPDFEGANLDYVHRQAAGGDIYFIRNTGAEPVTEDVLLRPQAGLAPELWHAETGTTEPAQFTEAEGRTRVRLHLEGRDSALVVFRRGGAARAAADAGAAGRETAVPGPWTVEFTPGWGAPAKITLDRLQSWTESADPGVRFYSGTAKYSARVQLPEAAASMDLDLGDVREMARVSLNGRDLGVVWKRPFRVELGTAAHAGWNDLTVEVTNLWPNRLIGDQQVAPEKRLTWTNITKFTANSPLLPSGLLGPVKIISRR
jgi:hypothetical protein